MKKAFDLVLFKLSCRNDRVETEDNIEQCETANEDVMKQANEEGALLTASFLL